MNIKPSQQMIAQMSPRNPWFRASKALDLAARGRFYEARSTLENIRYHPDVTEALFDIYDRQISAAQGGQPPLINIPADYLSHPELGFRTPFRRIHAGVKTPSPFPPSFAMPQLVGVQNDYTFLKDAATILAPRLQNRLRTAHILLAMSDQTDLNALAASLAAQTYSGRIVLTVFGQVDATFQPPARVEMRVIDDSILGLQANASLRELIDQDEDVLMCFLSGKVTLDPTTLERATYWARATNSLVQPLVPFKPTVSMQTPFTENVRQKLFSSRYPFREMQGLNLIAPSGLLRDVGLLETRFASTFYAARELAFRMFMLGKYFAPLQVSGLSPLRDDKDGAENDQKLYIELCPNHWDRKADGQYERPRVSVYIPAYNASSYIRRAVDSVLEQDVQDLEVCICNDGSRDNTADILEQAYGGNSRVRWVNKRNGGIGFGSNSAIHLSRAPYIGQLDSDDALKPGAVRRMMEYMDDNPDLACVYGSCERIDAEGNFVMNEYSWPVFAREKMMVTSIAHHFRMFRRSSWERTQKFREDIVNGIDYDIFLKLSETGPFHHVDEILYQRRWHGQNTSMVNEGHQTTNTYRVQNETLKRLGLDKFWEIHVPNPKEPRRVTYRRKDDTRTVLFWPDYSRSNPYQHMLYGEARKQMEICAGDIDAVLELARDFKDTSKLTFHLHWLNFILGKIEDETEAKKAAEEFIAKIKKFVWLGGRLVWTIHNHVSHDTKFYDLEIWLSQEIAKEAHALHFHSAASVEEVAAVFDFPREKVVISQHGHYIGAYPDFVTRDTARAQLGIEADDEVILFTGQVRPYKGVENLIEAFRELLKERPKLRLLIAGDVKFDLLGSVTPALTEAERERIMATERFVGDMELQLFLRAADLAVYPYQKILTSGSLLLALSYDLPVVIPEVGMTEEVVSTVQMGTTFDSACETGELVNTIKGVLDESLQGKKASVSIDEYLAWPSRLGMLSDATEEE